MIGKETFFNENTINIFTDASVRDHGDIVESVAGSVGIIPEMQPVCRYTRLIGSTNNEGEVYAIYMGILMAIDYITYSRGPKIINLFSDSKISVFGLRDWYHGWISYSLNSDKLISSSGQPVKNQEIFIRCMNLIIYYGLKINIYHLRGHIDPSKQRDYYKFLSDFVRSNYLKDEPSRELINTLSEFNNMVDYNTRLLLLPEGGSHDIPTITINGKYPKDNYIGVPVKPAFMFNPTKDKIVNEKKRYSILIKLDDIKKGE